MMKEAKRSLKTRGRTARARAALVGSVLILAVSLCAGCLQTHPKPQLVFHRNGESEPFKRFERYPQRDFFHHIARAAYHAPHDSDFDFVSEEQKQLVDEWGFPDYIRTPYTSMEDERVEEWVYLPRRYLFQFVDRAAVYEGEMTDLEQLMIQRGYPDRQLTTTGESGITKNFLVYTNVLEDGRMETFYLSNGWIIHGHRGN